MAKISLNKGRFEEEEAEDLRPVLSGSFDTYTGYLNNGISLLFTDPVQYASNLKTVDHIYNLVSKHKPTKQPLQFNQNLTNLLYKFSNDASPCVRNTDLQGNSIERLIYDHYDQISFKYFIYQGPFRDSENIHREILVTMIL